MTPQRTLDLKIVRGEKLEANQNAIVIGGTGKIQRDGNILYLRHNARTDLRDATYQLLRLLDAKYFTAGKFPKNGVGESEAEMIQKADLAGKLLLEDEN